MHRLPSDVVRDTAREKANSQHSALYGHRHNQTGVAVYGHGQGSDGDEDGFSFRR
jgi:hypothetical protein